MAVELMPSQKEALTMFRANPFFGLWDEVGGGKTFPAVFRIHELLMENPGTSFVIMTRLSLLKQTEGAIHRCFPELSVRRISGAVPARERERLMREKYDILIVNYDFFPKIEEALSRWISEKRLLGMVADEAHKLKGFRGFRSKYGSRAKSIMTIAAFAKYRYALSASPILNPNRPDVWGIYHFLSPKVFGDTLWKFEQDFYYNVAQGQMYKILRLKPTMAEELSRRMYSCARRRLKSEIEAEFPVELPDIEYVVDMPAAVRKMYEDMAQKAIVELFTDQGALKVDRAHVLARRNTLAQIAGGFIKGDKDDGYFQIDPSHRDNELLEIIEEIEGPFIIWAHYKHEIWHLQELMKKQNVEAAVVYGEVTGAARDAELASFAGHAMDGIPPGWKPCLIAHPGAAGAGLNLQRAGHDIRYSRSDNLEHREQSRGRIHRAGVQYHAAVQHHEIVVANTVDFTMHENLKNNIDFIADLTRDRLDKMFRGGE